MRNFSSILTIYFLGNLWYNISALTKKAICSTGKCPRAGLRFDAKYQSYDINSHKRRRRAIFVFYAFCKIILLNCKKS